MASFKDQIGNEVNLLAIPKRIVSLVPSQTEYLFDLGLDDEIVGVTKFCVHPEDKVKKIKKIGGTKNFHIDTIHSLKPDLIIGNKEENHKEGIEKLYGHYPVWISDVSNLEESFEMMKMIGKMMSREEKAQQIVEEISNRFGLLNPENARKALYLIWKKPYMTVGGDTFISHMMKYAGFKSLSAKSSRYPIISAADIEALQPEYILLSSEPYPFKEKHIGEFKEISSSSKILIVDGEMFSWFGSRLKYAADYFNKINLR